MCIAPPTFHITLIHTPGGGGSGFRVRAYPWREDCLPEHPSPSPTSRGEVGGTISRGQWSHPPRPPRLPCPLPGPRAGRARPSHKCGDGSHTSPAAADVHTFPHTCTPRGRWGGRPVSVAGQPPAVGAPRLSAAVTLSVTPRGGYCAGGYRRGRRRGAAGGWGCGRSRRAAGPGIRSVPRSDPSGDRKCGVGCGGPHRVAVPHRRPLPHFHLYPGSNNAAPRPHPTRP